MVRVLSMRDTFGDAGSYLIGDADGLVFEREADEENTLSAEIGGVVEEVKIKKTRRIEKPKVRVIKVAADVVEAVSKKSQLSKGKRG